MTLRQLDWMADERERSEWKRQAELMAVIANGNRAEGQPVLIGDDFNLSIERSARTTKRASIHALKAFLPTSKQGAANGGP